MAKGKRGRERKPQAAATQPAKPVFDSPFKQLKKLVAAKGPNVPTGAAANRASKPPAPEPAKPPPDESALLREALAGVRPLPGARQTLPPVPPAVGLTRPTQIVSEEAEVMAELADLVTGEKQFDITETEEYVEGARVGLDPRMIVRLRRGELAHEAYIDLHGMTQPDARQALTAFIRESSHRGRRNVLVVHGRGLGSPGGHPVLKHAAIGWLSHGSLSGHVLGFVTARPGDGGAGALYVLLRRERRRAVFEVLNGTKRHG